MFPSLLTGVFRLNPLSAILLLSKVVKLSRTSAEALNGMFNFKSSELIPFTKMIVKLTEDDNEDVARLAIMLLKHVTKSRPIRRNR